MITNTKMDDLIGITGELSFDLDLFFKIAWPEFVNSNGCILLCDQLLCSHVTQADFEDETSYEAFVNHIHLKMSEFGIELTCIETIHIAAFIAAMWKRKLSSDFPEDKFMIIIVFDLRESEATIRFHKIRDNQVAWINIEGIEEYEEPIMIL